jgi:hypothetical protein
MTAFIVQLPDGTTTRCTARSPRAAAAMAAKEASTESAEMAPPTSKDAGRERWRVRLAANGETGPCWLFVAQT